MAEDAVRCEPFSKGKFPANREIYRETCDFCYQNFGAGHCKLPVYLDLCIEASVLIPKQNRGLTGKDQGKRFY